MALRGVWQLEKLILSYCDWGGSSPGKRTFVDSHLPIFKEGKPQLEVVTDLIRENKNQRMIWVKNQSPEDIVLQATRLTECLGEKGCKA